MSISQSISHSRLVQKTIWSAASADREFSTVIDANEIAIVLVPKSSMLFHLVVDVPSGPFVLWQQWHKDMGQLSPGVIWFWPAWNRISHIVTRATVTYNCPVQDCHTSDNSKSIEIMPRRSIKYYFLRSPSCIFLAMIYH